MSVVESTCERCDETISRGRLYCDNCRHDVKATESSSVGTKIVCGLLGLNALVVFADLFSSMALLSTQLTELAIIFSLIPAGLALGQLIAAYGLWNLHQWGYTLGMVFLAINLAFAIVSFDIFSATISAVALGYIRTQKSVYF